MVKYWCFRCFLGRYDFFVIREVRWFYLVFNRFWLGWGLVG